MKKKRRKKIAKEWVDFQERHGLSDECRQQARAIGYSPQQLTEELESQAVDEMKSIGDRIAAMHLQKQVERANYAAAIESGEIKPKPKKRKKEPVHDPLWTKAKQVCRLNGEDIRMAKELGMSPKGLMKNVPGRDQSWKAPVKVWIRDLYEKRRQGKPTKPVSHPPQMVSAEKLGESDTEAWSDENSPSDPAGMEQGEPEHDFF